MSIRSIIATPRAAAIRLAGRIGVLAAPAALAMLTACATVQGGSSAMRDGGIVMPPVGWLEFCGRNADDPSCRVVEFDDARLHQLRLVQIQLRSVRLVDDRVSHGAAEYWQAAATSGDCEDVALAARDRLLAQGWPRSAVRLATAWTEKGDYHTVLTVDGVRGGLPVTYVLDNRYATVLSYQKLEQRGYRFDRRQAVRGPNWVAIRS